MKHSSGWDHPRSRGVYRSSPRRARSCSGSSPLARGLPHTGGMRTIAKRIIPARAGFTEVGIDYSITGKDHPRSRGVYFRASLWRVFVVGSSPLARGLPRRLSSDECHTWIIPARAGFTTRQRAPRNRIPGSSPLARGLRLPRLFRRPRCRIIPARAGFTEVTHFMMLPAVGSSPLARGLPHS